MSDSSDTRNNGDSTFLRRWSRRKFDQVKQPAANAPAPALGETREAVDIPELQEPPDVDTLDENSEVSIFFSGHVSEALKRQALRKLFHMDKFNFCDGLDDYAEDYTLFEPLGNTITAHQRLQKEREAINRLVSDEEAAPAAEGEAHQPETLLPVDNAAESADEEEVEQASADQTEPKEV